MYERERDTYWQEGELDDREHRGQSDPSAAIEQDIVWAVPSKVLEHRRHQLANHNQVRGSHSEAFGNDRQVDDDLPHEAARRSITTDR